MAKTRDRLDHEPEPDDGALFDAYLAALLAGSADTPDAFIVRHPQAGEELRTQIRALFEVHRSSQSGGGEGGPALPFEQIGGFRLLRPLRQGGMGEVYEARQESLGRTVALKLVRPEIRSSPSARARFEREAAVLARLTHPHVVTVYAFGEEDGVCYIAMELVAGRGLDELALDAAKAGTLLVAADVVRWGSEVARALACAHEAGVIHRDVKPANVRITPHGRAVLLDFGVAHQADVASITITGPLVGSPLYAAPEQFGGEGEVDERTDVYGLGAMLYECLGGRPVVERGTVEQVIHRKLHTEPRSLRSLNERIARDLNVVVMKALERDPARRYASASAFADDLEAVLAFQPIRARPPSTALKIRAWARRRPALAAATASLAAAVLLAAVAGVFAVRAEANERREDARRLVNEAGERVGTLGKARLRTVELEAEVRKFHGHLESRYQTPDRIARLDALELETARLRRERQDSAHSVLELLRRAERLDPEVSGTDAVRAALHLERFHEARTWKDDEAEQFHRSQVLALDPGGSASRKLEAVGRLTVVTDPPGADLYAFRLTSLRDAEGGAAPRQVPVPVHATSARHAGRLGLRVVGGTAALPAESLLVSVAGEPVVRGTHARLRETAERGGVSATVFDATGEREALLPAGLTLRPTAAPLLVGAESALGLAPLSNAELQPGAYTLLVRKEGYEDLRVFVRDLTGSIRTVHLTLHPIGTTPRGFVRVVRSGIDEPLDFWMMEREVLAREYLVFLNDPATLAAVSEGRPRYVPRGAGYETGFWQRSGDGTFALPESWRPRFPIVGVSHEDVQDYIRWMVERHPPPDGYEYDLPTHDEWLVAGGADTNRNFVFGNVFRPHWCASCFSRENADLEPVMDYPVDESPAGVFDLAGSASEWCSEWWDEPRGLLRVHGGSWAQARPELFKIDGGSGQPPRAASGDTGFRLVLRPVGEDR